LDSEDGKFAGVFESDDETAYFYLCEFPEGEDPRYVDAIHVCSEPVILQGKAIDIRWDVGNRAVGLLIEGVLWAVFDPINRRKFGGNYRPDRVPSIPVEALLSS
jgi:hypothetical protein